MCKLMQIPAFTHIKERLKEDEVSQYTGNFVCGEKATGELVSWCQDQ